MTPRQVAMIQTSWSEVEPISDMAATMFYERRRWGSPGRSRIAPRT
jgi:hypothetical protein